MNNNTRSVFRASRSYRPCYHLETLFAFKRAGADGTLAYATKEAARLLR